MYDVMHEKGHRRSTVGVNKFFKLTCLATTHRKNSWNRKLFWSGLISVHMYYGGVIQKNSHLTRHDAMAMCLYMEIVTQNVYHHRQTRFNGNARAKCTYTEAVEGVVNWGSRLRVQSESKKFFLINIH